MRPRGPGQNPLRFEADELALFLAEAGAVGSAADALALPFGRALELQARVERRYQDRLDAAQRGR